MTLIENNIKCYKCSQSLDYSAGAKLSRQDECPKCYASLHCCMMCMFYDKTAYNECKEPMANRILDKEKSNFCDFFKLACASGGGNEDDNLLGAANALFKN